MIGIKTLKKDSNKIRKFLLDNNIMYREFKAITYEDSMVFPTKLKHTKDENTEYVIENIKQHYPDISIQFIESDFPQKHAQNFKEEILSILNEEERKHIKTAFDVIGSIAILEIDKELENKEEEIARIIMKHHKNIKTVLKKSGIHEGIFRTQKMEYILGENTKETIHKENGIRLKLNVEKVYFSPRLSTERKRILEQINENEKILCMFSGVGPYPIVIAKHKPDTKIISIEINPIGVEYQKENIKLNKIKSDQIIVYEGDVRQIVPKLEEENFDRIIMPLPKSADDFIDIALEKSRIGTIIHLYDFIHEDRINEKQENIKHIINKLGFKCKINSIKSGQYAPREYRICHDIEVLG